MLQARPSVLRESQWRTTGHRTATRTCVPTEPRARQPTRSSTKSETLGVDESVAKLISIDFYPMNETLFVGSFPEGTPHTRGESFLLGFFSTKNCLPERIEPKRNRRFGIFDSFDAARIPRPHRVGRILPRTFIERGSPDSIIQTH